jgi:hypothetical protein
MFSGRAASFHSLWRCAMVVRAIPLARFGFIPVSKRNPVTWHLENQETLKLLDGPGYRTRQAAEKAALKAGYTIFKEEVE